MRPTKTDWLLWSATMAESNADFQALVSPVYDYLNETTTRDPLADSYMTDDVKSGGMHGIRNPPKSKQNLKFVAFLYHSA